MFLVVALQTYTMFCPSLTKKSVKKIFIVEKQQNFKNCQFKKYWGLRRKWGDISSCSRVIAWNFFWWCSIL